MTGNFEEILASFGLLATISTFLMTFVSKESDDLINKVNAKYTELQTGFKQSKRIALKYFFTVVLLNAGLSYAVVTGFLEVLEKTKSWEILCTLFVLLIFYCLILLWHSVCKFYCIVKCYLFIRCRRNSLLTKNNLCKDN